MDDRRMRRRAMSAPYGEEPMEIVCCQLDIVWEDKAANHAKVTAMLESARPAAGSLVLLPEMFATGFSMNVAAVADPSPDGPTHTFLAQTAKRFGVHLLGGLATVGPDGRGRNEAVLYSPQGRELTRYQKIQPFSPGKESVHYAAGGRVVTFEWAGFTVSPFICYDLRFPEIFRPAACGAGANLIAVIASWPVARAQHWVALLQARAIENQCYVAGANRCGRDPYLAYPGHSVIVDPLGKIVADAGDGEGLIRATP